MKSLRQQLDRELSRFRRLCLFVGLLLALAALAWCLLTGCQSTPPPLIDRCEKEAEAFTEYNIPMSERQRIYQHWKKRCPGLYYVDGQVREWLANE